MSDTAIMWTMFVVNFFLICIALGLSNASEEDSGPILTTYALLFGVFSGIATYEEARTVIKIVPHAVVSLCAVIGILRILEIDFVAVYDKVISLIGRLW